MREKALIIGASGGIGAAVAHELETHGWDVARLSRAMDGLDVREQANVDSHLGALEGPFQLVLMASGILASEGAAPEKALSHIRQKSFEEVFKVNTFGVAYVLGHAPKLLPKKGRSVLAVLTARVGSIGDNRIGGWYAYRASKAAANQLVRGAAVELGRSHKEAIVAALHPGTVATDFTADYAERHSTVSAETAAKNLVKVMLGLKREESGQFFDYAHKPIEW
ncbi:SDR family NAD(P)-dependent oxidoreductase [Lentibacter sp. XHP0401]|uniref:SDR family NAD(P)-dependent oxidoreductase n=1 Tax=Lentibacter sp. XHP0401 TaxID=2984334 RepID=UPI0021E917A6|nr:SDR family NAD(P)-dependent oxidoreductase [Lentibacter sp. XHP0401]MCV2894787.1 SDR family NAD(P)-dependent oxidoreductase [Lentibacter sp. XHP0401]